MKRNTFGKILSILLAVVMLASMLPATLLTASAEDEVVAQPEASYTFANFGTGASSWATLKEYRDAVNPNWKVIDYVASRALVRTSSNEIWIKENSNNPGAWITFEIDPTKDNLTEGVYTLWMNYTGFSGRDGDNASTPVISAYVAEVDETKTAGADYRTAENRVVNAKSIGTTANSKLTLATNVKIKDATKKHIVVIDFNGAEIKFGGFGLTKTADFPTSEVFNYANASTAGSNISLLFKDDTYGGLHTITGAGALRIRVDATKGDNADGKSWTATKVKFENGDVIKPGVFSLTMKTTTIYNHGASTKAFKLYMAEYDPNKTTGEEYMAGDTLFVFTPSSSSHALLYNQSASTVTHSLGSVVLDDLSKEYVFIIQLQGKEYHIENFTLTRTGDLPDYEAIDFKSTKGSAQYLATTYGSYGVNENPNWYVMDIDSDGNWGSTCGNYVHGDTLRFRVDADKGENSDGSAWVAFKFKFSNKYIAAGSYKLTSDTSQAWTHGTAKNLSDFYLAKYDANKTTGKDYMTVENIVAANYKFTTGGDARTQEIGTVVIDDMNAEYVLVMKNNGADPHIDNFKLTRVGDLPTSEVFSFAGANAHLHGGNWAEYGTANKNWKAYDLSDDYKNNPSDKSWSGNTASSFFRFADTKNVADAWTALKIRFTNPMEPGEYKLKYTVSNIYPGRSTEDLRKFAFYLAPIVDGKVAKDYKADYNAIKQLGRTLKPGNEDENAVLETSTFYITDTSKEFAFVIELEGCEIYLKSFELERVGDLPTGYTKEIDYSRFSLQLGETASPRVRYKEATSKKLIAAVAPFTAADPNVLSVSASGTVKGINPGRSTVSTTVDGVKITTSSSFQVYDGALVSGTANVYVHSIVDGVAGTDGVTSTTGIVGNVAEVAIGTSVTATADEEVDGAKFSHWMTSGGTFITSSREYTFKANTNAVAIAVYDSEEATGDEVTVSFYTGFGRLIETVVGAVNDTFDIFAAGIDGNFRGYVFDTWESVDGVLEDDSVITKNTTVVAQYTEEPGKDFAISIDGATEYYAYNEEVTATSDDANFSYWTRDGKIVSYNPTYMFYAWDDATIASVCEGATAARAAVVLASDGDEYMVEYDLPAGYTFVETGIVGFASGSPTVGSFGSKASSKKLTGNHGQFTAVCDETKVRGYVMYKDASGNLLVSYAD